MGRPFGWVVFQNLSLTRLLIIVVLGAAFARAQDLSFKIPPLATSVKIANQPVEIIASGLISKLREASEQTVLRIESQR